jgi:rhomboid family GlyGly-CTERM serine protease
MAARHTYAPPSLSPHHPASCSDSNCFTSMKTALRIPVAYPEWAKSKLAPLYRHPELLPIVLLIVGLNLPVLAGFGSGPMIFQPEAVHNGEWWRWFTHPFVHVTWYHFLLDATAFIMLYSSLLESRLRYRLGYVLAGASGSLLFSWIAAPALASSGLCGLSGIAHGLMAVSALEMVTGQPTASPERRVAIFSFVLVATKAGFEAISGRMFFDFLNFGLLGDPIAVSHAGGIIGAVIMFWLRGRVTPCKSLQSVNRELARRSLLN